MTEPAKQTAPASFIALFDSVERKINSVIDGARPLDVTGEVINEILTFNDDNDADDSLVEALVQQAEEIGKLKRALAGHAFDGESLSTRELVRNEMIELGIKRAEQHAALEEIAHAQAEQLAAAARQSSTYQKSVIERDKLIANLQRLRRDDVVQLQGGIALVLTAMKRSRVKASADTMAQLMRFNDVTMTIDYQRAEIEYAIVPKHIPVTTAGE